MNVAIDITEALGGPLPVGAALRVEVRDTSRADAAAETVAAATARVDATGRASVEAEVPEARSGWTVWAHVDVDGDGAVSVGDFITMESFPISPGQERMQITVREVQGYRATR